MKKMNLNSMHQRIKKLNKNKLKKLLRKIFKKIKLNQEFLKKNLLKEI